jgi:aspartyl-tRNA(Asn)/glutamyl-tRNA(Gln) amidotransferase subunit A
MSYDANRAMTPDCARDSVVARSCHATIKDVGACIRRQQISPVELLQSCLTRIYNLNPTLNAFITILADQALEQARTAEAEIKAGHWRGPLHGIPVGIKDMFDTAGTRTTAASENFKDRVPVRDAAAVRKLKVAGAIIVGKTNMHKLAMGTTSVDSYFGPVHNPWNPRYIAGGSSGGSAAAVAAGMVYASLDTDAIGSCRLPASCCAVTGFKGTHGLISNKGVLDGQPVDEAILWLGHAAMTTRSAEDTALILNILAEPYASSKKRSTYLAAFRQGPKPRIGAVSNFSAVPEVTTAFDAAVQVLRRLGTVRSVTAPLSTPGFDVSNIDEDRRAIAATLFDDIDVLVLPTTVANTPTIAHAAGNALALSPQNTLFANYYGLPAVSVPCGFDGNGLPLGLQVVGKPWNEIGVLRLAHQYANATPWIAKHPSSTAPAVTSTDRAQS